MLSKNNDDGKYIIAYSGGMINGKPVVSGYIITFEVYEVKGIVFSTVSSAKNVDIYYI